MLAKLVSLVLLARAVPDREAAPAEELARFQGEWQVVSLLDKGEKVPAEQTRALTVAIRKDRVVLRTADTVGGEFQIKLLAGRSPRGVDLVATRGEDKGQTYLGIYEFDGGLLRVALDESGRRRPTAFTGPDAAGLTIFVLQKKTHR